MTSLEDEIIIPKSPTIKGRKRRSVSEDDFKEAKWLFKSVRSTPPMLSVEKITDHGLFLLKNYYRLVPK